MLCNFILIQSIAPKNKTNPKKTSSRTLSFTFAIQTKRAVNVDLTPSQSAETVVVVFASGSLEVRAKRTVMRDEADGTRAKLSKTALESLKLPFEPTSVTVEERADGVRRVVVTKPPKDSTKSLPAGMSVAIPIEPAN